MVSFICNICGAANEIEHFATEPASCACGSNVRLRALIYLLSMELFGQSLVLTEFPKMKSIRGLGMTDNPCYARILADKFDYTNTYYDREPRFDFTELHPKLSGMYDFILSADVLEHIAPPVDRALGEVFRLLKPNGFFGITVYCSPCDATREHFPALHEYRLVRIGNSTVMVNRRIDGVLEVRDDLIFHGGSGTTLEMRQFAMTGLEMNLLRMGFQEVYFLANDLPEIGILFDHDVSQPLIARKEPFSLDRCATTQLIDELRASRDLGWRERERSDALVTQIKLASKSRWMRLGRLFGLGPKFDAVE
jgi:SAM-dependent methyltransferase